MKILRSFFRKFTRDRTPKEYYNYLRRTISRDELFEKYPEQANAARTEAWCETLGSGDRLNRRLDKRLKELTFQYNDRWVLIGGPPCQAYSVIGRSRNKGIKNRWLKYKIELLPIKEIPVSEQKPFVELVDMIIDIKQQNPQADITSLENQINQLVYKLYGLTEEEVYIVDGVLNNNQ